jgi:hypothetical protein
MRLPLKKDLRKRQHQEPKIHQGLGTLSSVEIKIPKLTAQLLTYNHSLFLRLKKSNIGKVRTKFQKLNQKLRKRIFLEGLHILRVQDSRCNLMIRELKARIKKERVQIRRKQKFQL